MKRRHWWFLSTTGRNLFSELSSIFNFKCKMVWRSEGEVLEEVLNCKEMVDLWKVGSIWPNWTWTPTISITEPSCIFWLFRWRMLRQWWWRTPGWTPGREARSQGQSVSWIGMLAQALYKWISLTCFEKVQKCRQRPPGVTTMVSSGNNK